MKDAELIEKIRRTAPPAEDVKALGYIGAVIKLAIQETREKYGKGPRIKGEKRNIRDYMR